jgi:hypothetical protein|nr:MAG TPA: hypothetical protein [Caudoviricetes sp.]
MPEMVHIQNARTNSFESYPVFDFLLKQELQTASLSFRSNERFTHPPGSLVTAIDSTKLAFIVESIREDSSGITEVNCISAWEFLKRRNYVLNYSKFRESNTYYGGISVLRPILKGNNNDPKLRMPFEWEFETKGYINFSDPDSDPQLSLYDFVLEASKGKSIVLTSYIRIGVPPLSPITKVLLYAQDVDSLNSYTHLGPLKASLVRQMPENPTHWMIEKTKDSGNYNVSSRGNIRTWKQNHAYMWDNHEYSGAYRYETGIKGDPATEWGPLTIDIKTGKIRTSYIEIEDIPVTFFNSASVGDGVSFVAFDLFIQGYVTSKTLSGSSVDTYSLTVQPQKFYSKGVDVTGEWT